MLTLNALPVPADFGMPIAMTAGIVSDASGARPLVFLANDSRFVTFDAAAGTLVDDRTLTPGVTSIHLTLDRTFLLFSRYTPGNPVVQSLEVRDARTGAFVRESTIAECPGGPCATFGGNPMAVTIDESHAIVANPDQDRLAYVYLQAPRVVAVSVALGNVVASVDPASFDRPQDQQKLLNDVEQIQRFLRLAEGLPDPAQQPMLEQAVRELTTMIEKFDGCAAQGSPDRNDVVTDCAEQAGLYQVAGDLATMIEGDLAASGCPPVVN